MPYLLCMKEFFTSGHGDARRAFVEYLKVSKDTQARPPGGLHDGPIKQLARKLRVSPARLSDFLDDNFELDVGNRKIFPKARLQKTVAGFATSVERALSWLQAERNVGKELDTLSIMRGFWPAKFSDEFERLPLIAHAIREGSDGAINELQKTTSITVDLWIPNWGPFGKSDSEVDSSFFAHYGKVIFRGIDPMNTTIAAKPKPLREVLSELPVRTPRGDWSVGVGTYQTRYRRFRGHDFVTFPAILYPLVGLLFSRNRLPDNVVKLGFRPFTDSPPGTRYLFDSDFKCRRFVAYGDYSSRVALHSVFPSEDTPADERIEILNAETPDKISNLLEQEITKSDSLIAYLADGVLAFEVFSYFINSEVNVRVIHQDQSDPLFAFSRGIMFRDEGPQLKQLLEESQQQLFSMPRRVVRLFETFVREIDLWFSKNILLTRGERDWPWDAPIFLYPYDQVIEYVKRCYSSDESRKAKEASDGILQCVDNYILFSDKHSVTHKRQIYKLFQSSKEVDREMRYSTATATRSMQSKGNA